MTRFYRDEGLILKKTSFSDRHLAISIFSREHGKVVMTGFGIKNIKSRRLSHLETGNYNRFSFTKKNDRYVLSETELMWGFSKIRSSREKLEMMYKLFFILNKILPENVPEEIIFNKVSKFLKDLNNNAKFEEKLFNLLLKDILILSGYATQQQVSLFSFNPYKIIENLIGHKINISFTD